jgi:uncharacterized protein YegP (UPF0339 family)
MGQRAKAPRAYYEVYQGTDYRWNFRLLGANHVKVAYGYGYGYDTKANAEEAVRWVRANAAGADGP